MKRRIMLLGVGVHSAVSALAGVETNAADSVQVHNLSEVEVVATRATGTTPVAFTNVTAREIAKVNTGVDLPYLLQATPSVTMTSDAGTGVGYSSIRVRGTDGSRINVTANGIPVNDAESQNVYWVNIPDFASTIKDVQVQRGAGTSTNGPGAFGASINMLTSAPQTSSHADFSGTYGMYNTNKETLRVGSGLMGGHWTVDARVSHIASDGYIDRASTRMWSYFTQTAWYDNATSLKLLVFGGKERTYNAWDYATKEQIEKYGRRYNPCGEYTDAAGNTAYYPDQYDNYTQHHFQLILNHPIGANWHLNAALHYTKGDGYYEQYKTSQKFKKYGLKPYTELLGLADDGTAETNLVDRSDLIRQKHMDNGFGGGIFSLKYAKGRLAAIVGGGISNYHGHHFGQITWVRNYQGPLDPKQEYYRNLADKLDANIYARAHVLLAKGLTGYADLQYRRIDYKITGIGDNFDDNIAAMEHLDVHREFNFFNPKVGADYTFGDNRVYASLSVAHREPSRDNFIDCAPDHQPVPERLMDYELGYNYQGKTLSGGANIYYMDYKDQLVATGRLSDTGNSVSENVPGSYRLGIELFWTLKPVRWFDWQFTTTFSRNRIRDYVEYVYGDGDPLTIERKDMPISFSPDVTLHNSLNFNFGVFDASVQSRYVGRQYLSNTGDKDLSLDPYFVTDIHAGCTLGTVAGLKGLRLGVAVYNVFSEKYESNGWAYSYYYTGAGGEKVIGSEAGYAVQAPIHVMGTVTLKF